MDPPLPRHPPSNWLKLFLSQNPLIWIPQPFSNLVIVYLLAYEDGTEYSETLAKKIQTEYSETLAKKIQTPGNYPEENIQHTEHGESLKSRYKFICLQYFYNS
jgi:hypothetical protein